MKILTLILPYYVREEDIFILLAKNIKLGKLSGFGGKAEPNEKPIDCALRELREESGLKAKKSSLIEVGLIKYGQQEIYCFLIKFDDSVRKKKLDHQKSEIEFVKWFNLKDKAIFLKKMFSGDEILIDNIEQMIKKLESAKKLDKFIIDKSENDLVQKETEKIWD